jgi:hypothetical protein
MMRKIKRDATIQSRTNNRIKNEFSQVTMHITSHHPVHHATQNAILHHIRTFFTALPTSPVPLSSAPAAHTQHGLRAVVALQQLSHTGHPVLRGLHNIQCFVKFAVYSSMGRKGIQYEN